MELTDLKRSTNVRAYVYIHQPGYNEVLQKATYFSWLVNGVESEDDWPRSEPIGAASWKTRMHRWI